MGRAWAQNLDSHPGVNIAGWLDVRPDAASDAAEELNIRPDVTGTDLETALKDLSPDFLVDVTPPEAHHSVTLTALRHGVPVLGEKPLASSMAEAREMVTASEVAGKLYMVSQSRRYNPQIRGFRRALQEDLGQLGILNVDFYIGAHFGGFRDEMEHVLLLDMAIHTFDAARFVSGCDPVSVYAEEFDPSWSWYRQGASAHALFEMTNGVRFNYRGSWCAEGMHTSWEGDWRAVGSNGTAKWIGDTPPTGERVADTGKFFSTMSPFEIPEISVDMGIGGSLNEFLHALESGTTPNGECHDNIRSLAMVFAAIESAKRGERVQIAEVLAS